MFFMKNKATLITLLVLSVAGYLYLTNKIQAEDEQPLKKSQILVPDLKDWPEASQKAAKEMMNKYGMPDETTTDMLIWNNNGVWLKTIVYKKEVKHDFPKPHSDVLEQCIHYRVSPSKYTELAEFNGSVTASRTNGIISSRCEKEVMNILALNLSYTIIHESKDVEKARTEYSRNAAAFEKGEMTYYTYKLNFFNDPTAPDPDKPFEAKEHISMIK